ncbi:winged helix-turn-helix domain-containing protein [Streptomyces sp. GSL17-111]|uniref:winged helix-turn-helix domain-containing protein n=1 Tax=Streptomyces sp. GSL17-111 TaxID=3121596 RepID=UPI0030F38212
MEGQEAATLIFGRGMTVREAATQLGMSPTTCWRRAWWFMDRTLPVSYGLPLGPLPPQRGTRACPRGRPWMPTLDGDRSRTGRARTIHRDGEDFPDLDALEPLGMAALMEAIDAPYDDLDDAEGLDDA